MWQVWISVMQINKTPRCLRMCAPISKLPSNISTMMCLFLLIRFLLNFVVFSYTFLCLFFTKNWFFCVPLFLYFWHYKYLRHNLRFDFSVFRFAVDYNIFILLKLLFFQFFLKQCLIFLPNKIVRDILGGGGEKFYSYIDCFGYYLSEIYSPGPSWPSKVYINDINTIGINYIHAHCESWAKTLVLILDGNSELVAHAWRKQVL